MSFCCRLVCFVSWIAREAALSWNGEGTFVFTSSSAPYDCFDNGPCDEVDVSSKDCV